MYEFLITNLRNCAEMRSLSQYKRELMKQAADAIEELQEDNAALNGTVSNLIGQIEELSKPRWVSVTDRLPDKTGNYLTAFGDGTAMAVNEFMHPRDWLTEEGREAHPNGKWYWGDVTHWMPLPEPPEEEV